MRALLDSYIVANRSLSLFVTAMSIASAWIWAPALFVSAQVAYRWGIEGLLWFIVPNFLTLFLFAFFAKKLRELDEDGYTLSAYIKQRVADSRVSYFYVFELLLLTICAIAVQLIAGAKLLSAILPYVEYYKITILLAIIPAVYTGLFGLRVSVIADAVQYTLMFLCLSTIVGYLFYNGYLTNLTFFGTEPTSTSTILLSFGIPTAIGLLSGAFGSQDFYQRTYAVSKQHVRKAYLLGAMMFIIIPLMMSLLGFLGTTNAVIITDTTMTNFKVLETINLTWAILPLTVVIICGLISTIDSAQASASAIFGIDIARLIRGKLGYDDTDDVNLLFSKLGIIFVTMLAIIIANLNITILQLFLIYGGVRSSVFGVTLVSVISKCVLNGNAIFYSLIFTIVVLLPFNIYAILNKVAVLQTFMAIAIVTTPGLIAYLTRSKS